MKLRLAFAFLLITLTGIAQKKKYEYKFRIDGLKNDTVYLGNYYGGKMYYNDTTYTNAKGEFSFKGEGEKEGGIYSVILADKQTYFEFVLNEPKIYMKTTKTDMIKNMQIKESKENEAYYKYIKYMTKEQMAAQELSTKMKSDISKEEKAKLEKELQDQQKTIEDFKTQYLKDYDGLFAAKLLKSYKDPEVPRFADKDGEPDQNKRYLYYKSHYFDNIDMKDDRLLRSPVLSQKIQYFLSKLTPQNADSILTSTRYLLSLTEEDNLIYKYIVQYVTTTYEKSNVMGMDAVFVGMCESVYANDKAWWLDSTKVSEIVKQYEVRKNLIVGKQAENIILLDQDSNWKSLHGVDADYTILFFWDPNCGHCKKELPKLKEFYKEWKNKGVEVFAVSTDFENADWLKFIKEHDFKWINVSDNPEVNKNAYKYIAQKKTTLNSLNFRDYWDIFSTPQVYILDKDKKIIAKRIMSDQMGGFIENYEKYKAEKAKEGKAALEKTN